MVDLVYLVLHKLDVARRKRLLRLLDEIVALRSLYAHNRGDERIQVLVDVRGRERRRTGNDERRPRLVDEDRVDLVDNREVVAVLHDVLWPLRHAVVAKVVETELAVGAVGDVARILGAPFLGVHRVLDTADSKTEKLVEVSHPGRVAAGEVVVNRNELDVLPGKRVQIERQGCNKSLAFARLHFGNVASMKDNAAD